MLRKDITIVKATAKDINAIRALLIQGWVTTYATQPDITVEDMAHTDHLPSSEELREHINASPVEGKDLHLFLVAKEVSQQDSAKRDALQDAPSQEAIGVIEGIVVVDLHQPNILQRLYIASDKRGKGIGKKLIQRMETLLHDKSMIVEVLDFNLISLALVKSCGFEEVGRKQSEWFPDKRYQVVRLRKEPGAKGQSTSS